MESSLSLPSSSASAASPSASSLVSSQLQLLSRLSSASSLVQSTAAAQSLSALRAQTWTEAGQRLRAVRAHVADCHRTIARIQGLLAAHEMEEAQRGKEHHAEPSIPQRSHAGGGADEGEAEEEMEG